MYRNNKNTSCSLACTTESNTIQYQYDCKLNLIIYQRDQFDLKRIEGSGGADKEQFRCSTKSNTYFCNKEYAYNFNWSQLLFFIYFIIFTMYLKGIFFS